ncbi:Patched family protein [Oleiphilus messinensis]|uniref:Patched family protein n=1 Tax=Oleiphilus messinensis TaxID=141451 RepID=A0A1Y0IEI1_9GAMM|nr:outer membrane lipoprotein-sorting protein [Oleiphilus messinensis]ARU58922.1 Patched family protein [Oleiphilus messinensis]
MPDSETVLPEQIFRFIVRYAKTLIVMSLLLFVGAVSFLPGLVKDTRSDAFLAADNPALVYRDKVKALFGLSDPMVVAVVTEDPQGIYNAETLSLVSWLTEKISALPNVDADRVVSLATESNIVGTEEGMEVNPFLDPIPSTPEQLQALRNAIHDFPLYLGTLVSETDNATLIVAEIIDDTDVEATYSQILDLVEQAPIKSGEQLHVAGEGAIAGYLGSYIDQDAQRLNPLAGVIITLIIIFAFRRLSPGLIGNVIIAASVLMTLGIMAANGTPFFVITNAMPVILIGISVADAIHVYSHYFELQARSPEANRKGLVVETMVEMWRPVTLTTLTTAAGFLGLYFASTMPPFIYFGLFTALGVCIAWFFSMVFLPATLALLQPSASRSFIRAHQENKPDLFSQLMQFLGRISVRFAPLTITLFVVLMAFGAYSASQLQVDENRIGTFHPSEAIVAADQAINNHLDGSNNLNIVIETPTAEDLFDPENLSRIEALQRFAETLPHVTGSTSIVDYLKQMNRALNEGASDAYTLPDSKDLTAQYFLLYSASGNPTDFQEEIDYDYRLANVRVTLNDGHFQETKPVVEALQHYISEEFNTDSISANLSGRVNLNYHWIKDLGASHVAGLGLALFLVWLVASLLFRSPVAGLYAMLPVVSSILLVYSAMVYLDIDLGIGTSMFASVAIGLGVDFAIHTIDRLRALYRLHEGHLDAALDALFPSTGRALFFNFLAIACGFGVLISSQVVPLNNFGTIVALSVTTSFIASMTLLPALIKVFRPQFIRVEFAPQSNQARWATTASVLVAVIFLGVLTWSSPGHADELPKGDWIVAQINQQDDGEYVTQRLSMTLVDSRGKTRERETLGYRKYFGDEKRTILYYSEPANVKGTAFLTYDYPNAELDDDQWLYLPALRKVRRISASDRGDYFLGTDFTYEDIKKERKIEAGDYYFTTLQQKDHSGQPAYLVEAKPRSEAIADELGYGRYQFWVDSRNWVVFAGEYWDPKGNPLKTLAAEDIRLVDGIWTRHKLTIKNLKTGHSTVFQVREVDYQTPVLDQVFTKRAMKKGF